MKETIMDRKSPLYLIAVMACLFGLCTQLSAQSRSLAFTMKSTSSSRFIPVSQTFSSDTTLNILGDAGIVYGLAVTMDVERLSRDFLVRILLEDVDGKRYLVAETYKEIAGDDVNLSYTDYCEETALLSGTNPAKLHLVVKNARVLLNGISVSANGSDRMKVRSTVRQQATSLLEQQAKEKVDQINAYNKANSKLWIAGITGLSVKPYEDRMRLLGCPDGGLTYGIEYYAGGIIDIGDMSQNMVQTVSSSPYIEEFDWRNRHGKNWLTSVKDQGDSGYCCGFAAVSCMEALVNLYLNKKVDLDLSDQEAACCNSYSANTQTNFYRYGMYSERVLEYVRDHGVCDEVAYPFVDDSLARFCRSDEVVPNELVTIGGFSSDLKYPTSTNTDRIKQALISYGPLYSGMNYYGDGYGVSHAMTLVGYGVVHAGDTIQHIMNYSGSNTGLTLPIYIEEDNPLVGKNYWIFKNNYINGGEGNPPYMYIVMDLATSINGTYALYNPVWRTRIPSGSYVIQDDVTCEDADGDGYYFWGLGPKPQGYDWVPDEPDGDDSDPLLGTMDQYGYCEDLNPETRDVDLISSTQSTTAVMNRYSHVLVTGSATWTVLHNQTFYNGSTITVKSGSTLVVNGATIKNAKIILEAGAMLKVVNDGKIFLRDGVDFDPPVGALVEMESGEIG